jgi:hypothetical protein
MADDSIPQVIKTGYEREDDKEQIDALFPI